MNKTLRIIFFVGGFVCVAILFWCHRVFCRRHEKKITTAPRLLIKKRWNGKRSRPASASPLRDVQSNRERSASYLPLISPYASNPPPLGFKNPAQQDTRTKTTGFCNYIEGPSTSQPRNFKNNSPPYPIYTLMPQPSTSKTSYPSARLRSETPDSIRNTSYSTILAYKEPDGVNIQPPEVQPYSRSNIVMRENSSSEIPSEQTLYELQDSAKNSAYSTHIYEVPYQESNWSSLPQSTMEDSSAKYQGYDQTIISYPPVNTTPTPQVVIQRPPSYKEAMRNNFESK